MLASARLSHQVGEPARARDDAGQAVEGFRRLGAQSGLARAAALLEDIDASD